MMSMIIDHFRLPDNNFTKKFVILLNLNFTENRSSLNYSSVSAANIRMPRNFYEKSSKLFIA